MEDIDCWEEKFESCIYSDKLLNKITELNKLVKNPVNIWEVKKACYYARKYHGSQMRQSGEPYYSHPIEVAYMMIEFIAYEVPELFTSNMINGALLHDSIEDTKLTEGLIAKIFNQEVASHVEGLTRIKPYGKITAEESLNLLIKQQRYDTALIKLFDRIHNIQTLGAKSSEKAKKIIEETFVSFVTLAIYLGIPVMKEEILQLCYGHLYDSKEFLFQKSSLITENNSLSFPPAFQNIIFQM